MFNHYIIHCTGRSETDREMLCSVLAQLEYRYQVLEWEAKGVPFRTHAYVPEIHPLTNTVFHEREDEGHVFKVRFYMYLYTVVIVVVV